MEIKMKIEENENDITSILFIMDSSSSMGVLGKMPIQSMRYFYNSQKETGKEFLSTLITFSDRVKFVHKNIKGSEIIIEDEDYVPGGTTALLDAIGIGIEYQQNIKSKNVICVILTDGHENSSKIYKENEIKMLTKKMEIENKWVFIYLGANQDSFAVSESLGINPRNSASYEYSPEGLSNIVKEVSTSISGYISREAKEDFTPELFNKTTAS
jgi:hypothetical protein